jgi:hypothetical protein
MTAGQDLIFFDNPEDWQVIVNSSFQAQLIGKNSHVPIPPQDLGVSLNEPYVAVIASTTDGKVSWYFAGDIRQVYNFAPGDGNPILGKIQTDPVRLAINKLQIVDTGRISPDNYRLKYHPPYWFKSATIRVYKYVGDALNFVEDTLFDIGNALGIDPNNPDGKLVLALLRIEDIIEQRFQELSNKIDNLSGGDGSSGGGGSGGGGSGGSGGISFGFTTSGGGSFNPSSPEENTGFGFFQGFL